MYSIHTFSRSKGVNVPIFNLVNCQSDTLFKILCNSLIGVFVVFRVLNPVEIYIFKNITCMNKRNDLYIHHFRCVFLLFKSSRILNMLNIYKSLPLPQQSLISNKYSVKLKMKCGNNKQCSNNISLCYDTYIVNYILLNLNTVRYHHMSYIYMYLLLHS